MRVQDIIRTKGAKLVTISQNAFLHEASKMISSEHVGMLLVVNNRQELVGTLSERDIVCFIAEHGPSGLASLVSAAMSEAWLVATPQDPVSHVMRVMTEERVRQMPVMSDGKLVGVVSIGDILNSRLAEKDQETAVLRDIARLTLVAAA